MLVAVATSEPGQCTRRLDIPLRLLQVRGRRLYLPHVSQPRLNFPRSDPGMVLGTAWRVDDDEDEAEDTSRCQHCDR